MQIVVTKEFDVQVQLHLAGAVRDLNGKGESLKGMEVRGQTYFNNLN